MSDNEENHKEIQIPTPILYKRIDPSDLSNTNNPSVSSRHQMLNYNRFNNNLNKKYKNENHGRNNKKMYRIKKMRRLPVSGRILSGTACSQAEENE